MLRILGLLAAGFLAGLVTGVYVDTSIRMREREGSRLGLQWIRFRIWVLYLWEHKLFYLVLLGICLLAGLLIGSHNFIPGLERGWRL